jgi:pilus assembly protein CpaC
VLLKIDREPEHVLIEVLVLEVDSDALEKLNYSISNYLQKRYSALSTDIGAEDGLALQFTFENLTFRAGETGITTNLKFTGLADILYRKNLARIIARPYVAALTGKESTLRITEDRSIVINQASQGASITTTRPVSSGIELKITPTVHLSGVIQMKVDVERSDFLTTTGNVVASKDTNKASTIMQVPSGQSIIIGGLMFNSRSASNAGLPWLRHVPFLNIFAADQQRTDVDKEFMIVVTPHRYKPGLSTPLPFLKVFQKPLGKWHRRATPTERFDFDQY